MEKVNREKISQWLEESFRKCNKDLHVVYADGTKEVFPVSLYDYYDFVKGLRESNTNLIIIGGANKSIGFVKSQIRRYLLNDSEDC